MDRCPCRVDVVYTHIIIGASPLVKWLRHYFDAETVGLSAGGGRALLATPLLILIDGPVRRVSWTQPVLIPVIEWTVGQVVDADSNLGNHGIVHLFHPLIEGEIGTLQH